MPGILGKKIGMTQVFSEDGTAHAVTVIKAGPCLVVQRKTKDKDGYEAVQLGLVEEIPARRVSQPMGGHFKKAGVSPMRKVREFAIELRLRATSTAIFLILVVACRSCLRRSSDSGGTVRRMIFPSTAGLMPTSLAWIAFATSCTCDASNGLTTSSRGSGTEICAI